MGKFQTHQRFELTAMIYFDLGGTYPLKIRPTQVHPPPPPHRGGGGGKPFNISSPTTPAKNYFFFSCGEKIPFKKNLTQNHPPPPPQGVRAGVKPLNMMYSCNLAMH